MNKPFIGITCNIIPASHWTVDMGIAAPNQDFQGLATDYLNMIQWADGIPVILPTVDDLGEARLLWEKLDGILLSGGNDVNPQIYHQRIKPQCGPVDLSRDRYEAAALAFALEQRYPVLGICRGIQMFNAALGGTNYQDLIVNGFEEHSILAYPRNATSHAVRLEPDSILAQIFQTLEIGVNSFHHQAIHELAPPLIPLAVSEDGVIEAVQVKDHPFAIAVQWHPEMMYDSQQQLQFARAFVQACSKEKCNRSIKIKL